MTLLEALKKRQKVIVIIKCQDMRLLTKGLANYRSGYLSALNKCISNHINSISDGNNENKTEATNRPLGMGRERDQKGSGDTTRAMGIVKRFKEALIEGCELCRRNAQFEVHKITLDRKGGYKVH